MNSTTHTTQEKELIQILQGIGITKNQATVYMAILALGPSPIWDIAQATGLKRSTCYSLLDDLILKGYASSTNDGKRAIYAVTSPKRLLMAAETRVTRFSMALSQFEAMANATPQKPVIHFYDGIEGVREVYLSCVDLPKGQEIYVLGDDAITQTNYNELLQEYMSTRIKKKIPINVLFVDSPQNRSIGPNDPTVFRKTRYLSPETFHPTIETQIAGDKIAYISHAERNPFAMVIENSVLAQQERDKFRLLWEQAYA